ncbi:MAG: hypothetical protein CTY37_08580 [Methylotenera sp.]|nr:MAG: hypothetical protein CTY37_08580 [Methylotenera sp.]
MAEITLVKLPDGKLEGLSDSDKAAYKRFKSRLSNLEAGELVEIEALLPRNSKFHRKFFALINLGFEHWDSGRTHKKYKGVEVTKNFDRFREDVLVLAGFYDQVFDLNGKMKLVAKSIKFARMEQDEFERLYSASLDVLLAKVFSNYKGRDEVNAIVEKIMRFV